MKYIAALLVWGILGLLGSGFLFAYVQSEFPLIAREEWREDLGISILLAATGPIFFCVGFCFTGFGKHGWRLWPKN